MREGEARWQVSSVCTGVCCCVRGIVQTEEEDSENRVVPGPRDVERRRGMFTFETIDDVCLPVVYRNGTKYISVSMAEAKLLSRYPNVIPLELTSRRKCWSFYITSAEAALLNEINLVHCASEYGTRPFTVDDVIVELSSFMGFYDVVRDCIMPVADQSALSVQKGGWLQLNNTVSPYVWRDRIRYVPLRLVLECAEIAIPGIGVRDGEVFGNSNGAEAGSVSPWFASPQQNGQQRLVTVVPSEASFMTALCARAGIPHGFNSAAQLISLVDVKLASDAIVVDFPPDLNPFVWFREVSHMDANAIAAFKHEAKAEWDRYRQSELRALHGGHDMPVSRTLPIRSELSEPRALPGGCQWAQPRVLPGESELSRVPEMLHYPSRPTVGDCRSSSSRCSSRGLEPTDSCELFLGRDLAFSREPAMNREPMGSQETDGQPTEPLLRPDRDTSSRWSSEPVRRRRIIIGNYELIGSPVSSGVSDALSSSGETNSRRQSSQPLVVISSDSSDSSDALSSPLVTDGPEPVGCRQLTSPTDAWVPVEGFPSLVETTGSEPIRSPEQVADRSMADGEPFVCFLPAVSLDSSLPSGTSYGSPEANRSPEVTGSRVLPIGSREPVFGRRPIVGPEVATLFKTLLERRSLESGSPESVACPGTPVSAARGESLSWQPSEIRPSSPAIARARAVPIFVRDSSLAAAGASRKRRRPDGARAVPEEHTPAARQSGTRSNGGSSSGSEVDNVAAVLSKIRRFPVLGPIARHLSPSDMDPDVLSLIAWFVNVQEEIFVVLGSQLQAIQELSSADAGVRSQCLFIVFDMLSQPSFWRATEYTIPNEVRTVLHCTLTSVLIRFWKKGSQYALRTYLAGSIFHVSTPAAAQHFAFVRTAVLVALGVRGMPGHRDLAVVYRVVDLAKTYLLPWAEALSRVRHDLLDGVESTTAMDAVLAGVHDQVYQRLASEARATSGTRNRPASAAGAVPVVELRALGGRQVPALFRNARCGWLVPLHRAAGGVLPGCSKDEFSSALEEIGSVPLYIASPEEQRMVTMPRTGRQYGPAADCELSQGEACRLIDLHALRQHSAAIRSSILRKRGVAEAAGSGVRGRGRQL